MSKLYVRRSGRHRRGWINTDGFDRRLEKVIVAVAAALVVFSIGYFLAAQEAAERVRKAVSENAAK